MIRCIRHWWQRVTRGFDDSVAWSLDWEFQKWIVPRLKLYKEQSAGIIVMSPEFIAAIDIMIEGFDVANEPWADDREEKLQKAYDTFAVWHGALWN